MTAGDLVLLHVLASETKVGNYRGSLVYHQGKYVCMCVYTYIYIWNDQKLLISLTYGHSPYPP